MFRRPLLAASLLVILAASFASPAVAANLMTVQPDGRILVAGIGSPGGYGAVARYQADGSLDRSFAGRGVLIDHRFNPFTALALAPDGGILAGARQGAHWFDFGPMLGRYGPDGRPDPSFGRDGAAFAPRQASGLEPQALLPNPDGSFVVGLDRDLTSPDLDLLQLSSSADLYGRDGAYLATLGSLPGGPALEDGVLLSDLLSQADGSILAVGSGPGAHPLFARFPPGAGGDYDRSFGAGAGLLTPFPTLGVAKAIAADGANVVIAGTTGSSESDVALARYDSGGAPVRGFGVAGVVRQPIPGVWRSEADAVAVDPDGRILVGGAVFVQVPSRSSPASSAEAFVARFTPDGSLDEGFGTGGVVRLPRFGGAVTDVWALPGGKVLAHVGPGFELAQLNADGSLDAGFGRDGTVSTKTCPGTTAQMQRLRCLPTARASLALGDRGGSPPTIRMWAGFNLPWARIQRLRLLLPPSLRLRVARAEQVKTRLVSLRRSSQLTVRAYAHTLMFNMVKAKRLLVTVPGTALRVVGSRGLPRILTFRVEVEYLSGSPETLVFHRRVG